MKKYKSCTAETGKFCSKHQCIHKEDDGCPIPSTQSILNTIERLCPNYYKSHPHRMRLTDEEKAVIEQMRDSWKVEG